jgi:hypothetical protein
MDESERAPQSLPHSLALIVADFCREIRASWLHLKGKSAELFARFSGDDEEQTKSTPFSWSSSSFYYGMTLYPFSIKSVSE